MTLAALGVVLSAVAVARILQAAATPHPSVHDQMVSWMRDNGGQVHQAIEFKSMKHGGFNVHGAVTKEDLPRGSVIVQAPQKMWLGTDTLQHVPLSLLDGVHDCNTEDPGDMTFGIALALEAKKGNGSFFQPMLRAFPTLADFHQYYPVLAENDVLADFGELPILRHLHLGHQADITTMAKCFNALQAAEHSKDFLKPLSLDDFLLARYILRTRAMDVSVGAIPAMFDAFNTATNGKANVMGGYKAEDLFQIRTTRPVPAGTELVHVYCPDCDNEMLLTGWGVYAEDTPVLLNDLMSVNCSVAWDKKSNANATHGSLREAAEAMLEVSSAQDALEAGWKAPRCSLAAVEATDQGRMRCSFARLAWEKCAAEWGYSSWESHRQQQSKAAPLLRARKEHTRIHTSLGVDLADKGDLEAASQKFRAALKIFPGYAQVYNNLAMMQTQLGDLDGAQSSFEKAVQLEPGNSAYKLKLGALLEGQKTPVRRKNPFEL